MFKDLNNETPEYLSSEFITGMDVTPCNEEIIMVNKLPELFPCTETFKKSFQL